MTPFEESLRGLRSSDCGLFYDALIDVNDTVEMAKKILLSNKVQNFTASDVVALTTIIIDREKELAGRLVSED